MLSQIIVLVLVFATACFADSPATSQPPPGLYCGHMPNEIYPCINSPRLVSAEISSKCQNQGSECDKMKCLFTESGWLDGTKVNKKKVSDYFDQYAADHPAWSPAVNHLKPACLGDHDLPAQGVYLNCPAYDIMHCVFISFIRDVLKKGQVKSTLNRCSFMKRFMRVDEAKEISQNRTWTISSLNLSDELINKINRVYEQEGYHGQAAATELKNATPAQWKTSETCRPARSYAAGCPVCPSDCFAPQVPYGSCNACMALPRSA